MQCGSGAYSVLDSMSFLFKRGSKQKDNRTVENCMGVYIFQQFILIALYYHTGLPRLCGSYALPWVGFALTVPLSFAGTYLMRKTRWGRFLVG